MFPHALNKHSYPKDRFLRRSRTHLEHYDDRKMINHGSIKMRLQHYLDKSFQDHYFYVVETKTCKQIIVRHGTSSRLGLIQVLCRNVSKSIVENKTNTNSRDSSQDPCLKIDGKAQLRNQQVVSTSFQEHPSNSFKTMAMWTCTESPSKIPAKDTWGRREQDTHKLTPFKTVGVDGIRVIREKDNADRVKDTAKNRGRETSFKTLGKSGRTKVSFQDMEHEVSKAPSFKTINKSGTNRVSFKTIEETTTNWFLSRLLMIGSRPGQQIVTQH